MRQSSAAFECGRARGRKHPAAGLLTRVLIEHQYGETGHDRTARSSERIGGIWQISEISLSRLEAEE